MNAKKLFKAAYGTMRKNAAFIVDRSADYYGQTDSEAFEQHAVHCVAKVMRVPVDTIMPSLAYRTAVAAAAVLEDKMRPVRPALTPQEKLAEIAWRLAEDEIGFD